VRSAIVNTTCSAIDSTDTDHVARQPQFLSGMRLLSAVKFQTPAKSPSTNQGRPPKCQSIIARAVDSRQIPTAILLRLDSYSGLKVVLAKPTSATTPPPPHPVDTPRAAILRLAGPFVRPALSSPPAPARQRRVSDSDSPSEISGADAGLIYCAPYSISAS
jgi:hypothetical protein